MTARRNGVALALALAGAAAMVPALPASAQIESIPTVTITAGGAYSSNPFLQADGAAQGAASTQIDVRPSVTLIDGTDTAVVSGNYNRADFLSSRYGSNSGYGARVSGNKRFNPRTSIDVTAAFDSFILGAVNGFITPATPVPTDPGRRPLPDGGAGTGPVVPTVPTLPTGPTITPIDPTGIDGDVGLIGARQRRNQWTAGVSGNHVLGPRSSVNLGLTVVRSNYPGNESDSIFLSDFRNFGANFGYTRTLDERSSIGFQVAASHAEFGNGFDSQIYTPRITYSRALSERWNLTAGGGAGITSDPGGTSTIVSFDGSLCRTGERTNGCVTAARIPTVTGFGGVRVQNTVGANFSYRFNSNMSAGVAGVYSHVEATDSAVSPILALGGQDLFSTDLSLQRRLGRRLSAVGSVSYRRGNGLAASIAEDVTARLGLSFAMGRFQ